MTSDDLVMMIGNLSRSLFPVQHLISGAAYLVGILFFITAISKLRKIGDARARSSSQEKMFVPLAYFLGGAALLFLPSAVGVLSNTTFGVGNILQYTSFNPYDITNSMGLIIQTVGLIWFFRGCVLLVHASEPGVQHGPKGMAFLCAGVLAMNFKVTLSTANSIIEKMIAVTLTVKSSQGF
ncbi:protein IcmC (DotV)-like protein [Legionella spiritensis]|uniref:Protein IcmC (DotV)-like protein n=2 Tax=Legionella spiritensis TaxID=452 RepID=A0A0W0Z9X6_LEGSP|nr:hypothetical protein [Legionella spiritensis]KTD65905.1 protein IcmC (DotV)-like protein [Legionella spiritensis]SNV31927.1 protein IcmC (DotV)-like protein [Legionella spiritensis]